MFVSETAAALMLKERFQWREHACEFVSRVGVNRCRAATVIDFLCRLISHLFINSVFNKLNLFVLLVEQKKRSENFSCQTTEFLFLDVLWTKQ